MENGNIGRLPLRYAGISDYANPGLDAIPKMRRANVKVTNNPAFLCALSLYQDTIVGNPDFRHQEKFLAGYAALGDGRAYTFFVVVCLCRVNHSVSDFESVADASPALGGVDLEYSIADSRHLNAVAEFYCLHRFYDFEL